MRDNQNTTVIKSEEIENDGISYKYELAYFNSGSLASFEIPLYGITVKLEKEKESSFYKTGGLFTDLSKAIRFFELIKKSFATPYDLPYVIEDHIFF